jgi:hypothetical protein
LKRSSGFSQSLTKWKWGSGTNHKKIFLQNIEGAEGMEWKMESVSGGEWECDRASGMTLTDLLCHRGVFSVYLLLTQGHSGIGLDERE